MNLVVELPPELERELAAEAARLQLALPEYALRLLAAGRTPGADLRSGAELVAYWRDVGVIGTRPEIEDALGHARNLREESQARQN
jgi:hypothetical protein